MELTAARLLDPWFGNSIVVWAALIGLVLACLSIGYWLGGRIADHRPEAALLYAITLAAALLVALIPVVSRPVLQRAALSSLNLENFSVGLLIGVGRRRYSAAFQPADVAAGNRLALCYSPGCVRRRQQRAGGRPTLYTLSTVGSLLGTFVPVLMLIPAIGTRLTFELLAGTLALVALIGLLLERGRSVAPVVLVIVPLLAGLTWVSTQGAVKPEAGLLHEGESLYNYYQVVQRGPETLAEAQRGDRVALGLPPTVGAERRDLGLFFGGALVCRGKTGKRRKRGKCKGRR